MNGDVEALFVHDDGGGAALYAGGTFTQAGSVLASRVARWNGQSWSALGAGLGLVGGSGTPVVSALAAYDSGSGAQLYAGGNLNRSGPSTVLNGIARFDGASWVDVGGGVVSVAGNGRILALTVFDSGSGPELVAAGSFTQAGGNPASSIARWNGASWNTLAAGIDGVVDTLIVHDDGSGSALYAGGQFTQSGATPVARVARWDGTSWTALGAGVPERVHALRFFDDGSGERLFATTPTGLYRFDGTTWAQIGPPLFLAGPMEVFDDGSGGGAQLYIGTGLGSASPFGGIVRWTGTIWATLDGGFDDFTPAVDALASFDDGSGPSLFVGGRFSSANGVASSNIARWKACGPVSSFCSGDGADAHVTTSCPCGNSGGPGRGCAWHNGPSGALLQASGAPNPDSIVLTASGMPAAAPTTVFLKGDALIAGGEVFGDGVRCIGGNLIRLGTKTNVNGVALYPEPGNASISVRGNTPPGSGAIGYYQTYFRNAASFCTSATFNVTNAARVVW